MARGVNKEPKAKAAFGALKREFLRKRLAELQRQGISHRRIESAMREAGVHIRLRDYLNGEHRPSLTVLTLLAMVCDASIDQIVDSGRVPPPLKAILQRR